MTIVATHLCSILEYNLKDGLEEDENHESKITNLFWNSICYRFGKNWSTAVADLQSMGFVSDASAINPEKWGENET